MKSFNSTIRVFLIKLVVIHVAKCSTILDDLHVFTGELFGNNFPNDRNHPLLREMRAALPICMEELGCFSVDEEGFFDPTHRSVNVLPFHRDKIKARYLLYTRMNRDQPFVLSTKNSFSLTKSTFNANRKTKFIIHGLLDTIYIIHWMKEMKDEFLKRGDYNVIIVDWSHGNQMPYTQATANCRVVGAEIALLIRLLEKRMGITQDSVHLIGHSLGAHISGYAGERLESLGRITGLDPAGPYFHHMPNKVRLDSTDAKFVDVWHTDAGTILKGSMGLYDSVGHVDYFPNDGHTQPGCWTRKPVDNRKTNVVEDWFGTFSLHNIFSGIRSFFICQHDRAIKLFIDSINKEEPGQCRHVAYECPDYSTFLSGKCADCGEDGKGCAIMSLDMEDTKDRLLERRYYSRSGYGYVEGNHTVSKKYFLTTGEDEPYCLYHYQIVIELIGNQVEEGNIHMDVSTKSGKTYSFVLRQRAETFMPGSVDTHLITSSVRLSPSDIKGVSITWTIDSTKWSTLERRLRIKYLKLVPMEYSTRKAQISNTVVFGASEELGHPPGHRFSLRALNAGF